MALKAPPGPTANLDFFIGLVGGLGVIMFIVTVVAEVTGQPALLWALTLLVLAVATGLMLRRRSRILRRHREEADALAASDAVDRLS